MLVAPAFKQRSLSSNQYRLDGAAFHSGLAMEVGRTGKSFASGVCQDLQQALASLENNRCAVRARLHLPLNHALCYSRPGQHRIAA